tara:strand:- start:5600 stop:6316 length:717 start_codon:yes stop_codon:yes gene_type:complete
MKSCTIEDVMSWDPCEADYPESRIQELFGKKEILTAVQILELNIPIVDQFWAVLRSELIEESILHGFACWCAEQSLQAERAAGRDPDPRSWAAIEAKRKWLASEINDDELSAAWNAARNAARSAAESAAENAARSAASWNAARNAARSAAENAAWSAAWNAARNVARSAARNVARSAAWNAAENVARSAARSAAWNAAESAAENAARSAAESAAWSAARSAAREAQRKQLIMMLKESS